MKKNLKPVVMPRETNISLAARLMKVEILMVLAFEKD